MRMPILLILGVLAVAATGCMHDAKTHGNTLTFDCSGTGKGWGDCTEKADAQCGAHKYAVVSREGAAEGKNDDRNTEMKRTLVVTCN
jgi:hypothetical protein